MMNDNGEFEAWAYIALMFTICSCISFNVPLDW